MDASPPPQAQPQAQAQAQAQLGAQPASARSRTCQIHGIVLGPFGRCVICQRAESDEPEDPGGGRKAMGILIVLLGALGGVLVFKGVTGKREAPVVVAQVPPAAAPVVDERASVEAERAVARVKATTAEQQRAFDQAMRRVEVVVYTTRWCELCGTAKQWMTSKHYAFTDVDAEASPENLLALRKVNPAVTVPTFVVDGEVLVGFGPGVLQGAMFRAAEKRAR
jgi:glutaredoxin